MKSSLAICLFGILAVLAAVQAKEFKHKLKAQTNELAAKDAEATTNLNSITVFNYSRFSLNHFLSC